MVEKDNVADRLGLEPRDTIVQVDDTTPKTSQEFKTELRSKTGKRVKLGVERAGKRVTLVRKVHKELPK